MKTFLIILQLTLPEASYPLLIQYLKSASLWARPLYPAWLIKTEVSADKIRDGIREKIRLGDKIFVIEIKNSSPWATSDIPKEVTDWMKENL